MRLCLGDGGVCGYKLIGQSAGLYIISTSMAEKSVEQKIKECRELIIQNMEKTIQNKMVYMFLKDRKKEAEVKQYSVNSKDGIIKIEFIDHEKAEAFYNEANFNDKILIRPFNIYYNLALTENEMKKYFLEGITEENQRKLFEISKKIVGPCKLYTNYGSGPRAKLKSTGLLSFIRKDPIPEGDFQRLTKELEEIGVKIFKYEQDRGTKVSLNLLNFISDNLYSKDESALQQFAENTARSIISKYVENPKIQNLSVLVKKKEIPDKSNPDEKISKVLSTALVVFENTDVTYQNYEKVRIGMLEEELGRVRLFFHNEENNSFLSLFTQGLVKPEGQNEKQFEESLIAAFKEINPNVIQVNVYPVVYNHTYIGRVYLRSEEEGKNFLVDYSNARSKIYKYYKEKNNIIFNISVDTKTLRKIKNAERKAKETEEKIKKQSEASRRDNRRPPNQFSLPPMNPMMMNPMMPIVGPGSAPGMMIPPGMNVPPRPDPGMMMGMHPPHVGPRQMPGPGHAPMQPQNLKMRIGAIIKDKERICSMDENPAKRVLVEPIRQSIQEQGLAAGSESAAITNGLFKDLKVENIFRFLEDPASLREAVNTYKSKQN